MKETSFVGARFFMGSVTNIANRPFRRLVTEYGADATIGEMAIAKYVVNGGKQDLTLIKRGPHDRIFGAQIVGGNPNHLAKAARLAEKYGADFVDFNCACPHQSVVSHGGGAILLRRPEALVTQLDAIRQAVSIPVSIKIRKGFDEGDNVAQEVADIAQKAGFNAIFIHGRTKAAQYRGSCDWELIEQVARNADVPVIGCGDLANGTDVLQKMPDTQCSGFALARGAITKPWIFKEIHEGHAIDPDAETRLEMLARLVMYTLETFGRDEVGLKKSTDFLCKQLDFLTRYVPTSILGYELPMQERAPDWTPRNELEALWKRTDRDGRLELLRRAGLPDTPEPRVREVKMQSAASSQDSQEAPNVSAIRAVEMLDTSTEDAVDSHEFEAESAQDVIDASDSSALDAIGTAAADVVGVLETVIDSCADAVSSVSSALDAIGTAAADVVGGLETVIDSCADAVSSVISGILDP